MAELKTKPTSEDVLDFIGRIEHAGRREDALRVLSLMRETMDEKPRMWGPSMIGFGSYHYKYASGHEGDAFLAGFAPRKSNLVIYLMFSGGFEAQEDLLSRLGKFKTSKACLYVNRLHDVDPEVLMALVRRAAHDMQQLYG